MKTKQKELCNECKIKFNELWLLNLQNGMKTMDFITSTQMLTHLLIIPGNEIKEEIQRLSSNALEHKQKLIDFVKSSQNKIPGVAPVDVKDDMNLLLTISSITANINYLNHLSKISDEKLGLEIRSILVKINSEADEMYKKIAVGVKQIKNFQCQHILNS